MVRAFTGRHGQVRLAVVLVVLLTTLGSGAAPVAAAPALNGPEGLLCGSVMQPESVSGQYLTYRATLWGGPVAATGTLTCTIQVDHPTHGTSANDAASIFGSGDGAVVLQPQDVRFTVDLLWWYSVYLCAQFVPASGPPLYWDQGRGWWSTDPNATCTLVGESFLVAVTTGAEHYLATDECAVLARLSPGIPGVVDVEWDGDLAVGGNPVWECQPYS